MTALILKNYYALTKPGIIYGNLLTAFGGFALASKGHIDWRLLLLTLVGLAGVIASACVVNNILDRHTDVHMERTKNRALVVGSISIRAAVCFALVLGVVGATILAFHVNPLSVGVALSGLFAYVVLYTLWAKRGSSWGAVVGSISGAVPPVVGYTAVGGSLDLGAVLLFVTLCLWQMPHFYAIALYRIDEYRAAGTPVLPLVQGAFTTKVHMLLYVVGFACVAPLLGAFGYAGEVYVWISAVLGVMWLALVVHGFKTTDNKKWGRKVFIVSLVVIVLWVVALVLGSL